MRENLLLVRLLTTAFIGVLLTLIAMLPTRKLGPEMKAKAIADCRAGVARGVVPERRLDACADQLADIRVGIPNAVPCDFVGHPAFCSQDSDGSVRVNNWMMTGITVTIPAAALSRPPLKF